jgi:Fe-S cluster assembly iron-binding protein IscA
LQKTAIEAAVKDYREKHDDLSLERAAKKYNKLLVAGKGIGIPSGVKTTGCSGLVLRVRICK